MIDDLAPLFQSRDTRMGHLPERVRLGLTEAASAAGDDPEFLDRHFSAVWLSRRLGVPRQDVMANFEGITRRMYGESVTASGVWDRIAADYQGPADAQEATNGESKAPTAPEDGQDGAEEPIAGINAPRLPKTAWGMSLRDASTLAGEGFQGVGLNAAAGFYSQLATLTGASFEGAPGLSPEYRRLANEREVLLQGVAAIYSPEFLAGLSDQERVALLSTHDATAQERLAAIEASMANVVAASDEAAKKAARQFAESTRGQISDEYRRLSDFWVQLAESSDERWKVDEEVRNTTFGQIAGAVGAMPAYMGLAALGPGGFVAIESEFFAREEAERKAAEGSDYDPQAALPALMASATGQAVVNQALGIERMLNNVLRETPKVAGRVRFGDFVRNVMRRSLRAGVEEAVEEPTQGLISDYVASLTYDQERELVTGEGAKRRLFETIAGFAMGMIGGGTIQGVAGVDAQLAARRQGQRMLEARDGQPMTAEEFKALRPYVTDEELRARAGNDVLGNKLVAAVNGDTAAMFEYNAALELESRVDTRAAVVDGVAVDDVAGVPVMTLPDGDVVALDTSDKETVAFLQEWQAKAAVQEKAAQERQAEPERVFQQPDFAALGFGQEARARFPDAFTEATMTGSATDQVPVVLREADGSEVPGLFNGYYNIPGMEPMASIARLTEAGWSHGVLMPGRGVEIVTPVPGPQEFQQPDFRQTGRNPQAAPSRINVSAELRRFFRSMERGDPDTDRLMDLWDRIQERQAQARNRRAVDRTRGADWIRERLLRARRLEQLSEDHVEFAFWLINQNPGLVDDVAISLRATLEGTASGTFNPVSSLVTIFTNRANDNTAVHEILHHAERLMPADVRKGIAKEWAKAVEKAMMQAKPERQEALTRLLFVGTGAREFSSVEADYRKGLLTPGDYALSNPSEFWAVNGTNLLRQKYEAKSWLARAAQWMRGFIERVRSVFGLRSDAAVLKGLRGVLDGSYKGIPADGSKMLSDDRVGLFSEENEPGGEMELRADRIRARMLDARGELEQRIAEGRPLPERSRKAHELALAERVNYLVQPIASRIASFNKALGARLRRFELGVHRANARDLGTASAFLTKAKRLSAPDQARLNLALLNGDREVIDGIVDGADMRGEYDALVALFERTRNDMRATGVDMGHQPNYWPRQVVDLDGLLDHYYGEPEAGVIQKALDQAREKLKRDLTEQERHDVVSSALRGHRPRMDRKPGATKERTTAVVSVEASRFYAAFGESLLNYITRMNEAIETRRFFGQHAKNAESVAEDAIPTFDLDNSIATMVAQMVADGQLDAKGQANVRNALNARFTFAHTSNAAGMIRNLGYLTSMAQFTSTLTQLGDWQFALYMAKVGDVLAGTAQAITGRSLVTRKDLGLDKIAEEFRDRGRLNKAVDRMFKATGMDYVVRAGQQSLINATLRRLSREARRGRLSHKMRALMDQTFTDPAEWSQAMLDLREGNRTDNTTLIAFNVLSDFAPVSLSEYPEAYLRHPNGRIFYALKTFDMKRFDAYRKQGIDLMRSGNAAQRLRGARNLTLLAALFLAAGAPIDQLKAWVIGREVKFSDIVWNNIWKLFALNRYDMMRGTRESASAVETAAQVAANAPRSFAEWLLPPLSWVTVPAEDVAAISSKVSKGEDISFDDFEFVRLIPVGGSALYWRFGKGARRQEERRQRERRKGRPRRRDMFLTPTY